VKLLLGFVLRASDGTYDKEHAVAEPPWTASDTKEKTLCGLWVTCSVRLFAWATRPCKRCKAAVKKLGAAGLIPAR